MRSCENCRNFTICYLRNDLTALIIQKGWILNVESSAPSNVGKLIGKTYENVAQACTAFETDTKQDGGKDK